MYETYFTLLIIGMAFALAGLVKGMVGMGLPTVAMGLLGLMITPAEGAALLVLPTIITNIWQLFAGAALLPLLKRLWSLLLFSCIGVWSGFGLMSPDNTDFARIALGTVLAVYSLVSLADVRFSVSKRTEWWLSPVMGFSTGLIASATGIFVVPGIMYVQAMNLSRDDFIQALGLIFSISVFALSINLFRDGVLQLSILPLSLLALVTAALGMLAGTWLRKRTHPEAFRKVFFVGLLILGAHLALHKLL
jgi:uncharacterized membrane protein YfcA